MISFVRVVLYSGMFFFCVCECLCYDTSGGMS